MNQFSKQPNEIFPVSMDFSNSLDTGETISSKSVIAYNATNEVVTSTIVAASSIVDNTVKVTVKDGTSGTRYKITIRITTSNSNIYEEDIFMYVKEG